MNRKHFLTTLVGLLAAGALLAQGARDKAAASKPKYETATFAGGCFWCMQPPFDKTRGVVQTVVGYTGGKETNPTYEQVSSKRTGHAEAIEVTFDPSVVSYEQLLDVFWRAIDPTQPDGQFADIGPQYQTHIYFHNEGQRKAAEASKERLGQSGKFSRPIAVKIVPASVFWPAEEYHQKYYKKNRDDYYRYAEGSGRYPFIRRVWGLEPRK
jgi:methionine-S-sulfoxide reductase